jgi:hypothetical protein
LEPATPGGDLLGEPRWGDAVLGTDQDQGGAGDRGQARSRVGPGQVGGLLGDEHLRAALARHPPDHGSQHVAAMAPTESAPWWLATVTGPWCHSTGNWSAYNTAVHSNPGTRTVGVTGQG